VLPKGSVNLFVCDSTHHHIETSVACSEGELPFSLFLFCAVAVSSAMSEVLELLDYSFSTQSSAQSSSLAIHRRSLASWYLFLVADFIWGYLVLPKFQTKRGRIKLGVVGDSNRTTLFIRLILALAWSTSVSRLDQRRITQFRGSPTGRGHPRSCLPTIRLAEEGIL
jgi:hypothetical protein